MTLSRGDLRAKITLKFINIESLCTKSSKFVIYDEKSGFKDKKRQNFEPKIGYFGLYC